MAQSAVADVVEYFDIDVNKDIPMIVAHQPVSDLKYKSKKIDIKNKELIQEFVAGIKLFVFVFEQIKDFILCMSYVLYCRCYLRDYS